VAGTAGAVASAELYTADAYQYGRYSARIQFAPGSGVVSSFFLWKDGSEVEGVFWNELDFEKLEQVCRVETNPIYGEPESIDPEQHVIEGDLCGGYHVYTYEWTPDYIAWLVDDVEIRREVDAVAAAYRDNTAAGMQLRLNVWPGDATFGGDFDPVILPVYEYIDWVEYSSYSDGAFNVEWREDFNGDSIPAGWLTASWDSPKGLSTHARSNVALKDGYAVLALTADDATGIDASNPKATDVLAPPTPSPSVTTPTDTSSSIPPDSTGTTSPAITTSSETSDETAGCACRIGRAGSRTSGALVLVFGIAVAWHSRRRAMQHWS
jgi:Glycosyl hydrolases family 16